MTKEIIRISDVGDDLFGAHMLDKAMDLDRMFENAIHEIAEPKFGQPGSLWWTPRMRIHNARPGKADPAKKLARKRQKKARAINRR